MSVFKISELPKSVVLVAEGVALAGLTVMALIAYNRRKPTQAKKSYPKDVVILHQFPRSIRTPSVSSFAMKLETWLRMAGIKYQNEFSLERSPKGKIPWITFNEEDVSDSQFCIDFLMKKFGKDLSEHLSPVDQSIARAFLKLNEESARWVGVIHRFRHGSPEDVGIHSFYFKLVGSKMLKECDAQGYGKHSKEELYDIGLKDLKAMEIFVGRKRFLMGENACNEDASIFGLLVQVIHNDKGPLHDYLMSECPNLLRYCNTMQETYWPDWYENLAREERK